MGWKQDQFLPPVAGITAVVESGLRPTIAQVLSEYGITRIRGEIRVWVAHTPQDLHHPLDPSPSSDAILGEMRLRFRRTVKPSRQLYFAQLKLVRTETPATVTDLIIRGEIDSSVEPALVKTTSCTVIHNRFDWIDPARL